MKLSMWTIYDFLIKDGYKMEAYLGDGLPTVSVFKESEKRTYSPDIAEVFPNGKDVYIVYDMEQLIVKNANSKDVANALNRALNYYSQWELDLYECMLQKGTLQDLLDIAFKIFNRPMFIKNDATKTLAFTKGYPDSVHPFWRQIEDSMLRGVPDYEMVRAVSQDPDYRIAFTEKYPSIRPSPTYGAMVLHANVFSAGVRVAEVVTLENGQPFNNGDIHLMNVFVDLVGKYVNNNTKIFQSGNDVVRSLRHLLQNEELDTEQFKAMARYIGKQSNNQVFLIVAKSKGEVDSPILSTFREKLESSLKGALVVQVEGLIVVLQVLKNMNMQEAVAEFERHVPKEGFRWASSFEFSKFENIPKHFRQTKNILEKAVFNKRNYVTMYEMEPELVAEFCREGKDREALVHPDIVRLEQADARDNTEYLNTLFYYLLCGGNLTDASGIMSLHRNTLIYRMNKIREIISSNLDDINSRKLLLCSYLLLDKKL